EETLLFKDTGIGMSAEKVKKLFGSETFTTLGTDNEKGTGLGLLLCKDFLNKIGGKIHAESEVGVGTVFYIQFGKN
ncbi:MAG: ATP-binding protein, partial [Bacteroidia bacterium]|nr:ATP-binding protein [Bacteroidia bacterium]